MGQSCWYETNFANLWRYAKNRYRNLFYDREADVYRILSEQNVNSSDIPPESVLSESPLEARVGVRKAIPGSK
jgi:hypothetical protein